MKKIFVSYKELYSIKAVDIRKRIKNKLFTDMTYSKGIWRTVGIAPQILNLGSGLLGKQNYCYCSNIHLRPVILNTVQIFCWALG